MLLALWLALVQPTVGTPNDAAAIEQFQAEVRKYMAIRRRLLDEVPGPKADSTAAELNQASDALAAAIRRRRPGTKPGAMFTPAVADVLRRRLAEAVANGNLGPALAHIDDEGGGISRPTVYLRFPNASQMATMPPSLIAALPELPRELEYRIVGTSLVLRDVDAALVLDFIPAAVPRK